MTSLSTSTPPPRPAESSSVPPLQISGKLTDKDLKRLINNTRSSTIGPTALYYAGVTAPVISAGMALVSRAILSSSQLSDYWIWFISALLAAMAGIVWYLIFVRWSYRHQAGRDGEVGAQMTIDLAPSGLHIRRNDIETRIGWAAIESVKKVRTSTLITFQGADPLLIPDRWFGRNKQMARAFKARLDEGYTHGPQKEKE